MKGDNPRVRGRRRSAATQCFGASPRVVRSPALLPRVNQRTNDSVACLHSVTVHLRFRVPHVTTVFSVQCSVNWGICLLVISIFRRKASPSCTRARNRRLWMRMWVSVSGERWRATRPACMSAFTRSPRRSRSTVHSTLLEYYQYLRFRHSPVETIYLLTSIARSNRPTKSHIALISNTCRQ